MSGRQVAFTHHPSPVTHHPSPMQTSGNTAAVEGQRLTARRIFSLVASELALVEQEFERQARSNIQVIAYIGDYLRASGGKRVRPALTLLSAYAVGGDASRQNVVRVRSEERGVG